MLKWWQETVIYQIYPRSFQDTNGDGIGDIPGIISRLDELKDLGVGVLWLSPVYPSPNADYGYDISDYTAIHPEYGTMADMDKLIQEAGNRGIKIIMDLVINHTSDQHPWFQASRDKNSKYRDYYIWRPAKNYNENSNSKNPPNNWSGFFGGGTWQFDEKNGEYYLHLFAKNQPDLNYYNPAVLNEIKDVMRFWLNKGVAGFRCDVINIIYKSSLADGKASFILTGSEHYLSQEGTHEILRTLRKEVLDQYDCFTVGETVFVSPKQANDLCAADRNELNMIFSFEHMETDHYFVKWFKRKFRADRFAKTISKWQQALEWNANYFENHDQPRSVSRFGNDEKYWQESAKLLCIMLLTLRGTPFIFQGQEIGMTNFDFTDMSPIRDIESINIYALAKKLCFPAFYRWKMIRDTSRDNARTPMQWSNEPNAGFTNVGATPWISINKNYKKINLSSQINKVDSIRSMYKRMISFRAQSDILKAGGFESIHISKYLFIYRRELNGKSLTIALNFSNQERSFKLNGKILISNYEDTETTNYNGKLKPWQAVVVE